MNRETRAFTELHLETRADGTSVLRGLPIVFDSLSEDLGGFREVVAPEAVTRALREDDVRGLFNHDANQILGRTSAGTMRLRATKRGVEMEIDLPATPVGQLVAEGVRRGDISGGSFGFITVADEWREDEAEDEKGRSIALRTLREVRLFDVGPVVFPAYPETSMGMRSLEAWRSQAPPPVPEIVPPTQDLAALAAATRRRDLDILRGTL